MSILHKSASSQLVTDSSQAQRVTIAAVSLSLILAAMQQIQKKKMIKKRISFHLGMCAYMITSNEDN